MTINPRTLDDEFRYFRNVIAALIPLEVGIGLEVGPFDRPILTKQETCVEYLDYRSTEELRAVASGATGHSPDFVVDVDFVVPGSGDWGEVPDGRYDWIISAHALEHSPNLIGFILMMGTKLKPGGLIISILPEKRRTFDVYRPATSLGRIVEDYLMDAKSPRVQSIFEGSFYSKHMSVEEASRESVAGRDLMVNNNNFRDAFGAATLGLTSYIDVHNYVFTSDTFFEHVTNLCQAELIPFICTTHLPLRTGHMSFLNVLKKINPAPIA